MTSGRWVYVRERVQTTVANVSAARKESSSREGIEEWKKEGRRSRKKKSRSSNVFDDSRLHK